MSIDRSACSALASRRAITTVEAIVPSYLARYRRAGKLTEARFG